MKKNPVKAYTIKAQAKINLHLKVMGKRPDGFHDLESIFATLTLADTLRFECLGGGGGNQLSGDWLLPRRESRRTFVSPEKNLVLRAIDLFRKQTGFDSGLKILLNKRIPVGAGLGGGSSDAASSLLALNLLSGAALPMEELEKMAIPLGSDVPFFLKGGAAFVGGRGDLVKPAPLSRKLCVLLVKPPFSSDTARAFRLLDSAREAGLPSGGELPMKELASALGREPGTWPFFNDFSSVFLNPGCFPNAGFYRKMLETMHHNGASFTGISGAGSCCYGIFNDTKIAKKVRKAIFVDRNYARLTFILARKVNSVLE
jgi:4-diphosphocytidyl-2-C-methyl-D-erythritol kinase